MVKGGGGKKENKKNELYNGYPRVSSGFSVKHVIKKSSGLRIFLFNCFLIASKCKPEWRRINSPVGVPNQSG